MTLETVRLPDPSRTASFVLAVAEARAVALRDGACLLERDGQQAYLTHRGDEWVIDPAMLFDPPAWTIRVRALITRHGR